MTVYHWTKAIAVSRRWASRVAEYEQTPDLWAELENSRELLASAGAGNAGNSPFTLDERQQIAARVEKAKESARKSPELSADQMAVIEQKLDQLLEASERVGRKDWLLMLQGAAFSLIATDAMP